MKKAYLITGIIAVLLVLAAIGLFLANDYRQGGGTTPSMECINYRQKCNCLGLVARMESFPVKYKCVGLEFCREINITQCRGE